MNTTEICEEIERLEKERAKIDKKLSKLKEDQSKHSLWVPKKGDTFYVSNYHGGVEEYYMSSDTDWQDTLLTFNCFKTKEEAKDYYNFEYYSRLAIRYIQEHSEGVLGLKYKWIAYYDSTNKSLVYDCFMSVFSSFTCPTREICQQMVEFIGEDNFIKYVLRVKER